MKRLIIAFGVLSLAFCAFMYYTLMGKETEKKSDQTAAARAARWPKKTEPKEESIIENEQTDEKQT